VAGIGLALGVTVLVAILGVFVAPVVGSLAFALLATLAALALGALAVILVIPVVVGAVGLAIGVALAVLVFIGGLILINWIVGLLSGWTFLQAQREGASFMLRFGWKRRR
jgi:hypothetical protein